MKFYVGKSDTNKHGTQRPGEVWNMETVRGPKLKLVRLGYKPDFGGWRLIYYLATGAWWYWDVYRVPVRLDQAIAAVLGR